MLLSVSLASAQVPIRVRGAIVKVSGQTLTIASRDNSTVDIKMADNFAVIGVVKAALSDIKPGVFVGVAAAAPADGSFRAQEVLVFPSRRAAPARGTIRGISRPAAR